MLSKCWPFSSPYLSQVDLGTHHWINFHELSSNQAIVRLVRKRKRSAISILSSSCACKRSEANNSTVILGVTRLIAQPHPTACFELNQSALQFELPWKIVGLIGEVTSSSAVFMSIFSQRCSAISPAAVKLTLRVVLCSSLCLTPWSRRTWRGKPVIGSCPNALLLEWNWHNLRLQQNCRIAVNLSITPYPLN